MTSTKLPESVVDTERDTGPLRTELDINSLNKLFGLKSLPKGVTLGYNTTWSPLAPPLTAKQFKFGQSNPTFLITDSNGNKTVLRKKPTSNKNLISKTAHAIEREFYLIDTINIINSNRNKQIHQVPVADVYLLCEDESYIGAVFYVMQFIKGRIFHDPSLSAIKDEGERKKIWNSVVDTAISIHLTPANQLFDKLPEKFFRNPLKQSKLSSKAKPSFFQRQVKSLSKIQVLQSQDVNPIPHFEEISNWLLEHAPNDLQVPTLIHGDFKIDNFVFHPTEPKIIAVLDWELCTNGHPLFDLANVLQPFVMSEDLNKFFSKFPIKEDSQLVDDILELYIQKLSPEWNPKSLWKVGVVFGLYRVAVICQGIAQRVTRGVASSAEAKVTGGMYPGVGNFTYNLIKNDSKL